MTMFDVIDAVTGRRWSGLSGQRTESFALDWPAHILVMTAHPVQLMDNGSAPNGDQALTGRTAPHSGTLSLFIFWGSVGLLVLWYSYHLDEFQNLSSVIKVVWNALGIAGTALFGASYLKRPKSPVDSFVLAGRKVGAVFLPAFALIQWARTGYDRLGDAGIHRVSAHAAGPGASAQTLFTDVLTGKVARRGAILWLPMGTRRIVAEARGFVPETLPVTLGRFDGILSPVELADFSLVPKTGELRIVTRPAGLAVTVRVYSGDSSTPTRSTTVTGPDPLRIPIGLGPVRVVGSATGHVPITAYASIVEGESRTLSLNLVRVAGPPRRPMRGILVLRPSLTGMTILIDGARRPELTPADIMLDTGTHEIELRRGRERGSHYGDPFGYQVRETVRIARDESTTLQPMIGNPFQLPRLVLRQSPDKLEEVYIDAIEPGNKLDPAVQPNGFFLFPGTLLYKRNASGTTTMQVPRRGDFVF
jgi:hypothetical protein